MSKLATKQLHDHNLLSTYPALAKEWHPTQNGRLTPRDVTPHSGKKVWWVCERGHEWEAAINNRSKGRGCPYCSGKAVCEGNCLQTINPSLAIEWHLTRNGSLTPRDVTPHSGKKVWWICGKGHEWEATVRNRAQGTGCPYCAGHFACEDNCLQTINPTLASQWHPTRNGSLTPSDVTPNSGKKVWWICNQGHQWETSTAKRSTGRGCPYCSGKAVCEDNCLQTINPSLAEEWHPTKNGSLTPKDVTLRSNKKVWWICKRGHEWKTTISHRSDGTGCPYCISPTSQLELAIYCEMKYLFRDVQHRKKIYGQECDIYIPELAVGIEIDSIYWHSNKFEHDKKKTAALKKKGVTLIRVREIGLGKIADSDIVFLPEDSHFSIARRIVEELLEEANISESSRMAIRMYLTRGSVANDSEYRNLLYMLPSPFPDLSLQELHPNLAKQWHPTKNGSLTPKDVTLRSNKKAWWICEKGHQWEALINNRAKGSGCPYCAGYFACEDNCLQTMNPTLAQEWHPTKNGSLTPRDVTPGSSKKVWWICKRGHEWKTIISDRSHGYGCPYCSGRFACEDNCLETINPTLARQWHPTKNGSLTPRDVTPGSEKKVWWVCDKGHEWKAMIANRSKGRGCPYCWGRLV